MPSTRQLAHPTLNNSLYSIISKFVVIGSPSVCVSWEDIASVLALNATFLVVSAALMSSSWSVSVTEIQFSVWFVTPDRFLSPDSLTSMQLSDWLIRDDRLYVLVGQWSLRR